MVVWSQTCDSLSIAGLYTKAATSVCGLSVVVCYASCALPLAVNFVALQEAVCSRCPKKKVVKHYIVFATQLHFCKILLHGRICYHVEILLVQHVLI